MFGKKKSTRSIHHCLYHLTNVQYPQHQVNVVVVCDVDDGMDSAYVPVANGYIEAIYPTAAFDVRLMKYGPALEVMAWAEHHGHSVGVMVPPQDEPLTIKLPY
jgi:hypothetical protein